MAKRAQQDSGEERVTAKSRPMMNLTARMPSVVSSSTSSSPCKTWYGYQDPGKSVVVDDRSGQPDRLSQAGSLKSDYAHSWSSQEWKSEVTARDRSGKLDKTSWRVVRTVRPGHEEILLDGTAQSVRNEEALRDRSGRPDNINSQEEARPQNFVIGNDETELKLSVESRSFVNRVNDQVRKRHKRISNVTGNGEEHSMIWGMFMAVTMESATSMGKNIQNNRNSIANTTDLTLKQMFDISAKLVSEQDEISGVETISWENHSWRYLSLIGDERTINLQTHEGLRLFRFCVVSWEDPTKS